MEERRREQERKKIQKRKTTLSRFCPAKLNLFLEVLGRRQDGYHELATLMTPIDFGDTLHVRRSRSTRLRVTPDGAAPVGDNTVLRAVAELRRIMGFRGGLDLHLEKRVPAGSGLGAGSSDAAACLLALNNLLGLGASSEELHLAATRVGSDVPFFLLGRTALATGRGERLAPLPPIPKAPLVLLIPPCHVSTPKVFKRLGSRLTYKPRPVTLFLNKVHTGGKHSFRGVGFFNRLEASAVELHPELLAWKRRLQRDGLRLWMSGSGASFFGPCRSREEAGRLARRWHGNSGALCRVVQSIDGV